MIQQEKETKKEKISNVILMIFLLLYPLRKAMIGLDLMDAGYALGNYRFFDTMNETWKLATYLSNVLGVLLGKLPFGNTWVGMNVYTSLLIGITASTTYGFLVKQKIGNRWILFLGELVALSLCWSPSVILYQYLGYIFMTVASMLLYVALMREKRVYFVIAGIILGAAVAIRMPNITYMALIIPVWFFAWIKRKDEQEKNNWFLELLGQTGYCILGYAIGLLLPIGYICIRYGIGAYPAMISAYFGMTDTATDYKPTSMVTAMFEDYIEYGAWMLLFLLYLVAGLVLVHIAKDRFKKTKKVLFIAGMPILLRLCYGRGMFDFDYTTYFSMYKWLTVFLLVSILLSIWLLWSRQVEREHKLWAAFMLVIIFVTPLGGNNGLYYIINNLFLVAPITMALMWNYLSTRYWSGVNSNENRGVQFVCNSMMLFLGICVVIQSILFGMGFVFHDAPRNGECYTQVQIQNSQSTKGLYTTVDKAEELNKLGGYLTENDLLEKEVILYGDIPAVSYIYDLQPAIYSTWVDLASNSLETLENELVSTRLKESKPLVIMSAQAALRMTQETEQKADKKLYAIYQFITDMKYDNTYSSEQFYVYEAP
ncbi:MAG: hypothetical protein UHN47_11315 [Lachnospiraceae bacterium]|nr:hypothetical protein [Lachnospiraceae bacterium]